MDDETNEKAEFKRGLKVLALTNTLFFLLLSSSPLFQLDISLMSRINQGIILACASLPFVQFIYLVPIAVVCFSRKKYAFLKSALLVGGVTWLVCPVTCAITWSAQSLLPLYQPK